ncbi:hypothetical protein PAXRUDRAFT_16048 [Paxillus rubicundulus Ve08.2h10]|uniref:Uncharacterized protein n=1 Tax=Paxillus rubicundulus Ve08.2h10 TaxID=930991 RepID=A0A0D0D8F2_9AGAM|nr:hypothetical protein PAXRUDRAFT_16048 [Paxillus rubicundulus Ve08.2h10]
MDFDFKHLVKRHATLLRSPQGITICDVVITREVLAQHLLWLGTLVQKEIDDMLSQGNAQNVPRAVKLLRSVSTLQALSPISYNPTDHKVHAVLKVLAALCESLVKPFFNPELSLNNQLKSLSKYAHLSFILYRQHTTLFMSNQLYGDTQAMIKNIMFLVAWQQEVDGSAPLYIIQSSED